jgi:hypothetical protein
MCRPLIIEMTGYLRFSLNLLEVIRKKWINVYYNPIAINELKKPVFKACNSNCFLTHSKKKLITVKLNVTNFSSFEEKSCQIVK